MYILYYTNPVSHFVVGGGGGGLNIIIVPTYILCVCNNITCIHIIIYKPTGIIYTNVMKIMKKKHNCDY